MVCAILEGTQTVGQKVFCLFPRFFRIFPEIFLQREYSLLNHQFCCFLPLSRYDLKEINATGKILKIKCCPIVRIRIKQGLPIINFPVHIQQLDESFRNIVLCLNR